MVTFLWLLIVVAVIVWLTVRWDVHPFLALLFGTIAIGFLAQLGTAVLIDAMAEGFGSTLQSIGIVIAAGAIIGEYLDRSGGANVLAHQILDTVGKSNSPLAMSLTGYVVSISVFCDSAFIVLSGLNKAIAKRTKISLTVLAVALATGLYATHVFVPPTPGPLAAAATLDADIGWVLLLGLLISIPVMLAAQFWATRYCPNFETTYERSDLKQELSSESSTINQEGGDTFSRSKSTRASSSPSFRVAIAPLLVPILLIALKSIAEYPTAPFGEGIVFQVAVFIGDPIIALLGGVILAFLMVRGQKNLIQNKWLEEALKKAGVIILITGAGGAFGAVLRETDLSDFAMQFSEIGDVGVLIPFLVAAFLKSAQGSSTVAIITAAAITVPLIEPLGYDSTMGKAIVVLAIGAGSLTVSHVNDSYFWVVAKFSEMDTATALKAHTTATFIMGITGLIAVQILAWILV